MVTHFHGAETSGYTVGAVNSGIQSGATMKTRTLLALLVFLATTCAGTIVLGQSTDTPGAFDAQKFEDQGRQLLEQFQQPGADPQKIMQQAGQMMQQFRDQTAGMTPQQIDQIRTQMMQHLQPLIIRSMPKIIQ